MLQNAAFYLLLTLALILTACTSTVNTALQPTSTQNLDPNQSIFFPRQEKAEGARVVMEGEISGTLILVDNCIRVQRDDADTSYLLIWPPDFTLSAENGVVEIHTAQAQAAAKVGDTIYSGGGAVRGLTLLDQFVQAQVPAQCAGPYWVVGEGFSASVAATLTPAPTITPLPLVQVPERTPIQIPTPISRTPVPVADDSFRQDLSRLGYQEYYGSSTSGPGGHTYSMYVYIDESFQHFTKGRYPEMSFRDVAAGDDQMTEGCWVALYRWDGKENIFVYSFDAPKSLYPYYYPEYPVSCMPLDWNRPNEYLSSSPVDPALYPALNLDGPWSDINHNGLPEFAMYYQYCPNGCIGDGALAVHFYEIQSSAKVVDITADLPGVIQPSRMIHAADPLELFVYDPSLQYCVKWCAFDTWWIYAWEGDAFVDVTARYADEIRRHGQAKAAWLKEKYGQYLGDDYWRLIEILFVYEKAGLRDEALAQFMEVSDPSHWTADNAWFDCWLQSARAQAQEDYRLGRAFRFPPFANPDSIEISLDNVFNSLDVTRYDLSACQALQKTPAP